MKQTNEMKVLRNFVEEFSPIHQGETKDLSFNELFSIVEEIVETRNEG